MTQISLTSGVTFNSSGLSILEAAAKAEVPFPYSCKTGRCSACKCRVISGKTIALHPELGLSEKEKSEGWVLGCVRLAETDVMLEVDDLGGIVIPPIKTLSCRISHLERLASNVIQVKLRLPPTAEFSFIPGQYVDLIGPGGVRRSYSLASAPISDNSLELHVRAVNGGVMSEYLFNKAKINDLLRINGPLGTFFLRNIAGLDLFYLATGTGIAPVKAMLQSLYNNQFGPAPHSVTVLWGGRIPEDFYYNVEAMPIRPKFMPVLSGADINWLGMRGYVQHALLAMQPNLSNVVVYACGSDAMIRDARELLEKNGLHPSRFYSDAFVCSSF